ncbi:MAG: tetratricopeptide repeat protein, partial [Lysobacteraceae bacterium]
MQAMPPSERYRQALAAFQQGRHADALALLRALLAEHPGHGDGWNLAGVIQDIGRDPVSASACFERAIAAGAGAGAMANLGLARQKLGRWELAEQAYRQAIQHDPGHALAWQKLGALLALLKRGHEALHCYREALR